MTTKNKNTKVEHLWSILCANSSIDYETNNLTLSHIVEDLVVATNKQKDGAVPNTTPEIIPVNFQIVSFWRKIIDNIPLSIDVKIDLVDPTDRNLNSVEFKLDFPGDKKRMRQRIHLPGQQVTVSGEYFYKISYREDTKEDYMHVYSIPLMVKIS